MNKEYREIDAANLRWKKRQYSRLAAIGIGILSLWMFAIPGHSQTLEERFKKLDEDKFTLKYDKFKDVTWAGTYIKFRRPKAKLHTLTCDIRARIVGKELTKASDDFFLVCSPRFSRGWAFLKNSHLIFLLDGERLDLGSGDHEGDVRTTGISEWVIYSIGRADLKKLGDAKKVEIQLGSYEGHIEDEGHPRVNILLNSLTP